MRRFVIATFILREDLRERPPPHLQGKPVTHTTGGTTRVVLLKNQLFCGTVLSVVGLGRVRLKASV